MHREIVRELIQQECTSAAIVAELNMLIPGSDKRERQLEDYRSLKELMGRGGASKKVALSMLKTIQED
jgi:lipid-A-disaccharide synthase